VKLKREYLDGARAAAAVKSNNTEGFGQQPQRQLSSLKLSGNDWYTQQAHRAVNQAVGRVIRSKRDYGAVLLLDSRFDQQRNQEGLSKWLRPHVRKDEGFQTAVRELSSFYKEIESKQMEVVNAEPLPPPSRPLESKPSNDENNENSQLALVRRSEAQKDMSESKGEAEPATFIPPNLVTRVKVDELAKSVHQHPPAPSVSTSRPQQKLPTSFDGAFQNKNPPPKPKPQQNSQLNPAASRFMKKLASFPMNDQTNIRKAIVTMKQSSDGDARVFLHNVRHVMELIRPNENLEEPPKANDQRLFFTLFELLSDAQRPNVEKLSVKLVFETSSLGDLSKRHLVPADYKSLRSTFLPLLTYLWFGAKHGAEVDDRMVLSKIQIISKLLVKCDKNQSRSLCVSFVKLMPSRFKEQTRALIDDANASRNIQNMRQNDKSNVGQNAIDMRRFKVHQPSYPLANAPDSEATATVGQPTLLPQPAAEAPRAVQSAGKPIPTNPYSRRPASLSGKPAGQLDISRKKPRLEETKPLVQPISKQNPYAKKTTKSASTAAAPVKNPYQKVAKSSSTFSSSGKSQSMGLKSMLSKIEGDSFVKKNPGEIARKFKSNAPKDLKCSICEQQMPEPYISECGHMHCLSCWHQWFSKSKSCPTCRIPSDKSKLSRVVYQDNTGS